MNTELLDTLNAILVEDFDIPADELGADVTFEALGLDSLDLVDLTLALEERTGIRLEDEELADIRTLGDAANIAEKKGANA